MLYRVEASTPVLSRGVASTSAIQLYPVSQFFASKPYELGA